MPEKRSNQCCPPESVKSTGNVDDDIAGLCKALGHPARVRIVRILSQKGVCISGDLAEAVDLAPSTVSEHLRILKEAGLISGTIDGPKRCYCVNNDALRYVRRLLEDV